MAIKGPYTKGRKQQMTQAWKELVRCKLDELGISLSALERSIGAGKGALSRMLDAEQNTSVHVAAVCAALKMPPPGKESDEEAELLANFRSASPEGKRALLQHAASAAGVAGKTTI